MTLNLFEPTAKQPQMSSPTDIPVDYYPAHYGASLSDFVATGHFDP